jgi:hypothetical protein
VAEAPPARTTMTIAPWYQLRPLPHLALVVVLSAPTKVGLTRSKFVGRQVLHRFRWTLAVPSCSTSGLLQVAHDGCCAVDHSLLFPCPISLFGSAQRCCHTRLLTVTSGPRRKGLCAASSLSWWRFPWRLFWRSSPFRRPFCLAQHVCSIIEIRV